MEVYSTVSIDEILVKLHKDIIIDNENYGYILIPRKSPPEASSYYPQWDDTYNGKNFGWRIEVSQETGKVIVKPYKENKVVLVP